MNDFKKITGTFLDGLPCDIPSQNWGRGEWARQFDVFKEMGIDSVIVIRVGFKNLAMYDSKVIKADVFDADDSLSVFLEEAERVGIRLYMGLYDSLKYWFHEHDNEKEVAVNLHVIDELLEKYGKFPAFYGWYLSHEPTLKYCPWEIWEPLTEKMRRITPEKPILLSPRFEGQKYEPEMTRSPENYARVFDDALNHMACKFDVAAFMDGHVDYGELSEYMSAMKPVLTDRNIEFWSNVEVFDRDMPFRFPPISWMKLRKKLEVAQPYVSKIVTFEAPHFLSPYSMWESGRMLYSRYMEYIQGLHC